jgi:hypothetical protein
MQVAGHGNGHSLGARAPKSFLSVSFRLVSIAASRFGTCASQNGSPVKIRFVVWPRRHFQDPLMCLSSGPLAGKVQHRRNTRFEFVLKHSAGLDKITIPKHAGPASNKTEQIRLRSGLGLDMKLVTGLLAAVLLLAGVGQSYAFRISDDRGGRIGTYVDKYQGLKSSGETVVIDGLCASACTIVLGAVAHDKICVTSHATLGFHAAWDYGDDGRAVPNREATRMLYAMYPSQVQRWIRARGGLTPHMIFLRGKELQSMYRPCYLDAQASAAKPPVAVPTTH